MGTTMPHFNWSFSVGDIVVVVGLVRLLFKQWRFHEEIKKWFNSERCRDCKLIEQTVDSVLAGN